MTSFANSFQNSTLALLHTVCSCCKAVTWNKQELCLWNWEPNIQALHKFWKLFFMITQQTTVNYQFFHGALHVEMGWLFLYSSLLSLHRVRSCDPRNLKAWAQNSLSDVGEFFSAAYDRYHPTKDLATHKVMNPTITFCWCQHVFVAWWFQPNRRIFVGTSPPKGSKWTSNRLLPSDIGLKVIFKNQQVVIWFLWTLWYKLPRFSHCIGMDKYGQYHGTILVPE